VLQRKNGERETGETKGNRKIGERDLGELVLRRQVPAARYALLRPEFDAVEAVVVAFDRRTKVDTGLEDHVSSVARAVAGPDWRIRETVVVGGEGVDEGDPRACHEGRECMISLARSERVREREDVGTLQGGSIRSE
jgi:hypothetical protein